VLRHWTSVCRRFGTSFRFNLNESAVSEERLSVLSVAAEDTATLRNPNLPKDLSPQVWVFYHKIRKSSIFWFANIIFAPQ
jgi:hypothetical protein